MHKRVHRFSSAKALQMIMDLNDSIEESSDDGKLINRNLRKCCKIMENKC